MISEFKHQYGSALLVKVGAMYINSIVMLQESKEWRRGDEIAYFSFGSTVILLFEKDTFIPDERLHPSLQVKMGEVLGSLAKEHHNAPPPKCASGFFNCCLKSFSPWTGNPLFPPGYGSLINQKTYKTIKIKEIPSLFPPFFVLI